MAAGAVVAHVQSARVVMTRVRVLPESVPPNVVVRSVDQTAVANCAVSVMLPRIAMKRTEFAKPYVSPHVVASLAAMMDVAVRAGSVATVRVA